MSGSSAQPKPQPGHAITMRVAAPTGFGATSGLTAAASATFAQAPRSKALRLNKQVRAEGKATDKSAVSHKLVAMTEDALGDGTRAPVKIQV